MIVRIVEAFLIPVEEQ